MHSTASFGLRASFGFRNDKRNPRSLVELWVADSCVRLRFVTEGEKMSDFGLRFCDEAGDIERVSISLAVSIDSSSSEKGLPPQKERKLIPLIARMPVCFVCMRPRATSLPSADRARGPERGARHLTPAHAVSWSRRRRPPWGRCGRWSRGYRSTAHSGRAEQIAEEGHLER